MAGRDFVLDGGVAGSGEAVRRGRRRDPSRDAEILDAALDVLADVGYDGLTMDLVAAKAKAGKATMYRRWPSKEKMILDAVLSMKEGQVGFDDLPDTGTLRGDLISLIKPQSTEEAERKLRVMSGLASMLYRNPENEELSDKVSAAVVEPWADAFSILLHRAMERDEIRRGADMETLSRVIPSMVAYRSLIQHKTFDPDFVITLIDSVLLPALRKEDQR